MASVYRDAAIGMPFASKGLELKGMQYTGFTRCNISRMLFEGCLRLIPSATAGSM